MSDARVENIVYVLGAGFSAPLGLPLISNFLLKAKEYYYNVLASANTKHKLRQRTTNAQLKKAFTRILGLFDKMSVAKNYFETDLFNIEELLSINEMQRDLDRTTTLEGTTTPDAEQYIRELIRSTITHFTPPTPPDHALRHPGDQWERIFGDDPRWQAYGAFSASLLRLGIERTPERSGNKYYEFDLNAERAGAQIKYSVISLNYDRVLEIPLELIGKLERFDGGQCIAFRRPGAASGGAANEQRPWLCKLHGCVSAEDSREIVPPTWKRGDITQIAAQDWKKAGELLSAAHRIRFVGYSLPLADLYVRYFLKASATKSNHLKEIDVICLDPDGLVKSRFDEFIAFPFYRFKQADVWGYLTGVWNASERTSTQIRFGVLEAVHDRFMQPAPDKDKMAFK